MKLSDYQSTMRHICAPYGLEERILSACTQKKVRKSRAPRLVTAVALALALVVGVTSFSKPNQTANPPFSLKVSAAEAEGIDLIGTGGFDYGGGDFFMQTDGKLERCATLFFTIGDLADADTVDRVEIKAQTGAISCYHQSENSDKDWENGWDCGSIILPREVYDEAVADPENPTKEEIHDILTTITTEDVGPTEYQDATYLWINAGADGTVQKELLPILDELEIHEVQFQTKGEISKVILDFKNPQSVMREKDVNVKSLSIRYGEEIEWMPNMEAARGKDLSEIDFTAFSDLLDLKVYYKDGSTMNGEIHIEVTEDGALSARFDMA